MRPFSGRTVMAAVAIVGLAFYMSAQQNASTPRIRVVPDEGQRRVDVIIDEKPFTAYIWPEKLAKPVLYPVRTAKGALVTRGYPLEPRPGERVDHPHHVGMWFNYGNVSGFDFWNNSEAIKAEDAPKMGNIRHRATTLAKLDNTGVNGSYLTSEGKKGDAAWGTRGRWCNLSGQIDNEPVTITILDHPANPGFPTYWHARGYGLFAANPLGQKIFSNGKQELNFSLAANQRVTFRYRILITSEILTPEKSEAAYKDFVSSYR